MEKRVYVYIIYMYINKGEDVRRVFIFLVHVNSAKKCLYNLNLLTFSSSRFCVVTTPFFFMLLVSISRFLRWGKRNVIERKDEIAL